MCNNTLINVAPDLCNLGAPGIIEMKVALAKWIDEFPAPVAYTTTPPAKNGHTVEGDITFDTTTYSSADWMDLKVQVDRNGYETTYNETKKTYATTLNGFVPLDDQNPGLTTYGMDLLNKSDVVMLVKDKDGFWQQLGTPSNPVTFVANLATGNGNDDDKGWTIAALWKRHKKPPLYYTGAI